MFFHPKHVFLPFVCFLPKKTSPNYQNKHTDGKTFIFCMKNIFPECFFVQNMFFLPSVCFLLPPCCRGAVVAAVTQQKHTEGNTTVLPSTMVRSNNGTVRYGFRRLAPAPRMRSAVGTKCWVRLAAKRGKQRPQPKPRPAKENPGLHTLGRYKKRCFSKCFSFAPITIFYVLQKNDALRFYWVVGDLNHNFVRPCTKYNSNAVNKTRTP